MAPNQQPVWGMENGSQTHKRWHVLKVSLSGTTQDYWYFVVIICDGLIVLLYYVANCGHPMINNLVGVVDYDNDDLPTEQGTTINFICPPSMSLNGPNSITCMDNGEWEPDPSSIHCKKG